MRGADARSAQICRPNGVTLVFQVSRYSVEPRESKRAANLFSKHHCRRALAYEVCPHSEEVSVVDGFAPAVSNAKRLTRAASGPDRTLIRPPGEPECIGPPSNAGEEMGLGIVPEVVGSHVDDASLVNISGGDMSGGNEIAEPLSGIRVDFIVVGTHFLPFGFFRRNGGSASRFGFFRQNA